VARHRLIDGRKSRFSSQRPKTHIIHDDGPVNALDQRPTLCGAYLSTGVYTGPLRAVDCERCLASLERQKRTVRG